MSRRSILRLPPSSRAWLGLWLAGLVATRMSAADPGTSVGKKQPPHAEASAPDRSPAGQEPAPAGFTQWLQELKRQAGDRDHAPKAAAGWALFTKQVAVTQGTMLRIFPGAGHRARLIRDHLGHGRSVQDCVEEADGFLANKPLHPFFAVRGDERIGLLARLRITSGPGRTEHPPRELTVGMENQLGWLGESGCGVQALAPTGSHSTVLNAKVQFQHLLFVGDLEWVVRRHGVGVLNTSTARFVERPLSGPLEKGSRQPVTAEGGRQLFVPMPEHVLHLRCDEASEDSSLALKAEFIPATPESRNAGLMVNRAGSVLVHARPDQSFLYVRRMGDEVGARLATAADGVPVCLAQGKGSEVWFLQIRPFGVGCLDTDSMRITHLQPEGRAAEVQEPHAAALGPDGNLWFTDRKGCRIGRITRGERSGQPVGEVTLFDLGKGQHPEEIVCSMGAWLYFTVKDQPVIGSIRAVDARPEDACGPFVARPLPAAAEAAATVAGRAGLAEASAAAGEAARPKRKLSGAERRKRRLARERAMPEAAGKLRTEIPLERSLGRGR